jgi:hypothetical protein
MADEPQSIEIQIPPELETGVYANFAIVHSSQHEITIDLGQTMPRPGEDAAPTVRIVSRIRIAPSFVGPLLQVISQNAFRREDRLKEAEEGEESHE